MHPSWKSMFQQKIFCISHSTAILFELCYCFQTRTKYEFFMRLKYQTYGPYHMVHIIWTISYEWYDEDHMSSVILQTSNQFICMHPSESHKQIARPVLNHLCKTGNREISSPWFRTADDPASIRFSFMNFLQWLTCKTISLSFEGWFLTQQNVSWKLLSKNWIFSPSACSKILLKSLNWIPTELSLRA